MTRWLDEFLPRVLQKHGGIPRLVLGAVPAKLAGAAGHGAVVLVGAVLHHDQVWGFMQFWLFNFSTLVTYWKSMKN